MATITTTFTTKPSGCVDIAEIGESPSAVSSNVLFEGAFTGSPANGYYLSATLLPTPAAQGLYNVVGTQGGGSQYYAGAGVMVGADSAGNKGFIVTACALGNFEPTYVLATKVGTTWTRVTTGSNGNGPGYGVSGLQVGCQITFNGTYYVYTPVFGTTVQTSLAWTDTAGVLGTPGLYWGPAFATLNSSGQYKSDGIASITETDTGSVTPAASPGQFFALL